MQVGEPVVEGVLELGRVYLEGAVGLNRDAYCAGRGHVAGHAAHRGEEGIDQRAARRAQRRVAVQNRDVSGPRFDDQVALDERHDLVVCGGECLGFRHRGVGASGDHHTGDDVRIGRVKGECDSGDHVGDGVTTSIQRDAVDPDLGVGPGDDLAVSAQVVDVERSEIERATAVVMGHDGQRELTVAPRAVC